MRELTIPSSGAFTETSIAQYPFNNKKNRPNHVALRVRRGDSWADVTSTQFADEVLAVAKGVIASGIAQGDRVAIMCKTRYEWTVFDFALLAVGAIVVPIYETSSAEQVDWILTDSGARAIVVEAKSHEDIVNSVKASAPALEHIWQIDADVISTLKAAGASIDESEVFKRIEATQPSDTATLIYTSGTTGRPKGCELTHGNVLTEVTEIMSSMGEFFNMEGSTLLFLPIAHVFGRAIEIGAIAVGSTLGHSADIKNLIADFAVFKPTFVLSVPRVFEKVYNTAKQTAHGSGKGKIFDRAEAIAIAYSESLDARGPGLLLKVQHGLFDKLVYGKLRAALGGQCAAAISGGAPLGARLGHFFRGIGVTVYEGYGLTETTAGATLNVPNKIKVGSVGRPVGGMSVKIADDGEILISGPIVYNGYWRNDAATAEAIETVGGKRWFHSGDIGEIDNDGFVKITGRKKELIVTAGGKNVAPAVLEDRVRAHWLVSQCLVVGDKQPYIAALITIDPEAFPQWLHHHGKPADTTVGSLVNDPDLLADVQSAVDDANKAVSKAEAIKKFSILSEDWTEATGQLTPSLKLKRNVVMSEQAAEIASLYGGGGSD